MTDLDRMLAGKLYDSSAPILLEARKRAKELCYAYNTTQPGQSEQRQELLGRLLGSMGEACVIEPPFRCDYGTYIQVGDYFYANYDLIILDICPVRFGNHVMIGPRTSFLAASHPIDPQVRSAGLELGAPITVGDHVWIGGQVVVNGGVTIGEGAVIGSGSVVTRDIPPMVVAAGNPCRVLRAITQEDKALWIAQDQEYRQSR